MIFYKSLLIVALLNIFLPFSKGHAEKLSSIGLEILGNPISAIKSSYSCAPTMIAGPSKRKIICANSFKKYFFTSVKNRIVAVQVIQFTTETSIDNLQNGYSESCQKSTESNFKLELNCDEQKTIIFELDISASELRTEFCFFQHCRTKAN